MTGPRICLNGVCIFAATSFVIFAFDLSSLWYGAALLAWIVRMRSIYQSARGRPRERGQAEDKADSHPPEHTAHNL